MMRFLKINYMENLFGSENILNPQLFNQMLVLSGVFVTLKIILFIYMINHMWTFGIYFGNYLKHTHPKSFFRKIFWSSCDIDGQCDLCTNLECVEIYKVKI